MILRLLPGLLLLFFMSKGAVALEDTFSGRISKINPKASLIRFFIKFHNVKFLNKKDQIEFWNEHKRNFKCTGYVVGKSNEYLLVKVLNMPLCSKKVEMVEGGHLNMYSQDLENNLKVAQDVVQILVKKRLAIESKLNREKLELNKYIEKIDAVNQRYQVLRSKMEHEWQEELSLIQSDKLNTLRNFKNMEIRMGEIDHKLEEYKIYSHNLELDRWSLDSRQYYRK